MDMPTMRLFSCSYDHVAFIVYSNVIRMSGRQRKSRDISISARKQKSRAGSLIQKEECFKNRASEYKGLTVASPVSMAQPLYHGNRMPVGSSMWV